MMLILNNYENKKQVGMTYTIQISADAEWQAVKSLFKMEELKNTPFGEAFCYKKNNINLWFFHGGTTKTRAAASCQYAIDTWKPDRHFLLGTAGGVDKNIKVNDIVIAEKTAQYDHIYRMGEPCEFISRDTIVDIDNSWIDISKLPGSVCLGFIATADQDVDHHIRQKLMRENVTAADWESGAVAMICLANNTPCTIIRGISDIPEDNADFQDDIQGKEYLKNTPKVMVKIIRKVLLEIINFNLI